MTINIQKDAKFMSGMGIFLLVLTVMAFAPRYFIPIASGTYAPPSAWMHPHAVTALAWTLIFIIQPWLITRKNIALHRKIGIAAVLIAVANLISGIAVQFDMFPAAPDDAANIVGGGFRLLHSTPAFALFFVVAIMMRRKSGWHLRFMYQTAIAGIATILGRLYVFYLPLGDAPVTPLIPIGNVLFVIALPIYDKITYGKVHPASWWGVVGLLAFQAISTPIVFSDGWAAFATG